MSKRQRRRARGAAHAIRGALDGMIHRDEWAIRVAVEEVCPGDILVFECPSVVSPSATKMILEGARAILEGDKRGLVLTEGIRLRVLRLAGVRSPEEGAA